MATALLLLLTPVSAATPIDQGALLPSAPREEQVEAGAEHAWTVALLPGYAYALGVEQLGTNLKVIWDVLGQGRTVNDWRGRSGEESVIWVSEAHATATVVVRSATSRPARYRILLAQPRLATSADRDRHAAENAFASRDLAVRWAAVERFAALGLEERRTWALDRLSYLAASLGDAALARQAAHACVTAARAATHDERLASCLCAVGSAALADGDLDAASEAFRKSLELRERLLAPGPIATVLNDWSNVLLRQGDYEQAEALLRRALELSHTEGEQLQEAVIQAQLGILASYRGDLETAVVAFERAFEVSGRSASVDLQARFAVNLGVAYGQLGDTGRSIARLQDGAALAESNGLKPVLALARLALGAEYEDASDLGASVRELEAGIALAKEIGDAEQASQGQGQLAWTLARQGLAATAEARAQEALASARESNSQLALATACLNLGRARLHGGRSDTAEQPLLQAQALFTRMGRIDDQGRALTALARYSQVSGDLEVALERATRALEAFESVRTRVALSDQRARYSAFRREAYDVAVGVLLEREQQQPGQGYLARAFEISERARARSLIEELAQRRGEQQAQVPPELARRWQATLDRIGHVQRGLVGQHTAASPNPTAVAQLERALERAAEEEETARREIRAFLPRRRVETLGRSAAELQGQLARDEVLLEYHVAEQRSWLFVLSRNGLQVATLPGEPELRQQAEALRSLLARPSRLGAQSYALAAQRLFGTLVAPAAAQLEGVGRLRVVPDGPLWEIPFEALVTEAPNGAGFAELPYLLRRLSVSYQPSASALAVTEERTARPDGPDLVAFADADFTPATPAGASWTALERAVFREGERWSLSRLACARREARDVAAHFGAGRTRVHLGSAALESRVKSDPEVAKARYLLFSTHALLSETIPSQSALLLSPGIGQQEDGLLQVHEIDRLDLTAELVVLSACESALGPNLRGEGLLGLARAFFHTGARELVASLWKVADCSTAELNSDLFRRLQAAGQRAPAADALRYAKLRLLGRRTYAHPYYWAPFVLIRSVRSE